MVFAFEQALWSLLVLQPMLAIGMEVKLMVQRLWVLVDAQNGVYNSILHNLANCLGILEVCTQGGVWGTCSWDNLHGKSNGIPICMQTLFVDAFY